MAGGIFSKSLGHKLVMSISGLFLILFLFMHLSINLTLLFPSGGTWLGRTWGEGELFNAGAHFMISTPLIRIMEPLLALGFVVHIVYGVYITWRNRRYRPVPYSQVRGNDLTQWPSKNMFILGSLIFVFLVLHMANFFWHFRFGDIDTVVIDGVEMDDSYSVVAGLFKESGLYCVVYIVGSLLLGLHLSHGFWSAFQTLGWNNVRWVNRLRTISWVLAVVIGVGFASIPFYFLVMG